MASQLIYLHEGVWDIACERLHDARCRAISERLSDWIPVRSIDVAAPAIVEDDSDLDTSQEALEFEAVADVYRGLQ